MADYPDGGLSNYPITNLTEQVRREIREQDPDLMLVIDPAEGDADDAAVARAVCRAAEQAGVPVLARMRPAAHGGRLADLGPAAAAAHAARRSAIAAHASQSRARPRGEPAWQSKPSRERLRWLIPARGLNEFPARPEGSGRREAARARMPAPDDRVGWRLAVREVRGSSAG